MLPSLTTGISTGTIYVGKAGYIFDHGLYLPIFK